MPEHLPASGTEHIGYEGASTTSDATVFQLAQALIEKHGSAEALSLALGCMVELAKERDSDGYSLWRRIMRAIGDAAMRDAHAGELH